MTTPKQDARRIVLEVLAEHAQGPHGSLRDAARAELAERTAAEREALSHAWRSLTDALTPIVRAWSGVVRSAAADVASMTATLDRIDPDPDPDPEPYRDPHRLSLLRDVVDALNRYDEIHRAHGMSVCVDEGHDVWEDVILGHPAYDSAATDEAETAGTIDCNEGEFVTTAGVVVTGPNYSDEWPVWEIVGPIGEIVDDEPDRIVDRTCSACGRLPGVVEQCAACG